jgi:hypothetical protein
MHLALFSCNFIIESQKYLRGHLARPLGPLEICGPHFAKKNVLEDWKWEQTSNMFNYMCVRQRMGENRMDGRMEVMERERETK